MKYTILKNGNLLLEDVEPRDVVRRNFSGEKSQYGTRDIAVRVPDEIADELADLHYNMWERKTNDAGEYLDPVVSAKIDFFDDPDDNRNPVVKKISSKRKVVINSFSELDRLDRLNFSTLDLELRVFSRQRPQPGYSTAVKYMNFVLDDYASPLASKYNDVPDYEDD